MYTIHGWYGKWSIHLVQQNSFSSIVLPFNPGLHESARNESPHGDQVVRQKGIDRVHQNVHEPGIILRGSMGRLSCSWLNHPSEKYACHNVKWKLKMFESTTQIVYLPTWMLAFYGKSVQVGKYTIVPWILWDKEATERCSKSVWHSVKSWLGNRDPGILIMA